MVVCETHIQVICLISEINGDQTNYIDKYTSYTKRAYTQTSAKNTIYWTFISIISSKFDFYV